MGLPRVNPVTIRATVKTFNSTDRETTPPDFVGQTGWQIDTQTMWVANSSGGWQQVHDSAFDRIGFTGGLGFSGGAMRLVIPIPSDPEERPLSIRVVLATDIHFTRIIKTIDASNPELTNDSQPVVNAWSHMRVFTGSVFTQFANFDRLGPPYYQQVLVINLSSYLSHLATTTAQKPIYFKYRWANNVPGAETDWIGGVLAATPTSTDELPIITMPPGGPTPV